MLTLAALSMCLVAVSGYPRPQGPGPAGPLPIPRPGADGSYAGDNHFQYINVPAHKTFEWATEGATPITTERSTSARRTTPSRPSSSGLTNTVDMASTTTTSTT